MTCTRPIGEPGEKCRTCGRLIVRRDLRYRGHHSLEHEGPTMAQQVRSLAQPEKEQL